MAHQQTNCEGPPTPNGYNAAFDFNSAYQEPYYYDRPYEHHQYYNEQQMAEEIFRLLRFFSRRLDAQDNRRAHHFRFDDTDGETADHRNALTSPAFPIGTDRLECAHTTVDENPSPVWQSTTAEKGRPQASSSAPDTTTSENPCEPYNQSTSAYRDTCSELVPIWKGHNQDHIISVEKPEIGQATDPNHINSTTNCQTKVPRHIIQIDDVDHEGTLTTPQAIPRCTKPTQAQNTPRAGGSTPDGNKEPYRHIPQNPVTSTDKAHTTSM